MDNQENNQSDLQELHPGDDLSVDFDDLNVELTDTDPGAAGLEEVTDLSAPAPMPGELGSDQAEDPEELEPVALSEEELENILGDTDVQDVLSAPIEEEMAETAAEPAAVFDEEEVEPLALEDAEAPADEPMPVDDDIFLNDGDLELDDADLQLDEPDMDLPELGADDLMSDEIENPDEIDTTDELDIHDIEELEMPDELMSSEDDTETLPPLALDDDEDDEPVTLSEDELGSILDDVEPSDEIQEGDSAPMELAADTSPPATADDEEEDILSLGDDEPLGGESALDSAPDSDMPSALAGDEDEDESITLSDEELSRVLLDTDEMDSGEDSDALPIPDLDDVGDESSFELDMTQDEPAAMTEEPTAPGLTSLDMEDDEPITLTAEELGNIVSDTEEEAVDAPAQMAPEDDGLDLSAHMSDAGDDPEPAAVSILDDDDDDEPVALSENELANILEDVDDAEPIEAAGMEPMNELEDGDLQPPHAGGESPVIVLDEYDDSSKEDDAAVAAAAIAGAGTAAAVTTAVVADDRAESPVVAESAAEKGVDIQEMKKMISYLDGLFDKLPDDTVREFSRSEYFDLYKKIMGELGL